MASTESDKEREEREREWRELGGRFLRARRKSAGLNQKELAARAGTNQSTISDWERGNASPTVEQLAKLLDAMGYKVKLVAEPKKPFAAPSGSDDFAIFGTRRGAARPRPSRGSRK